MLSLYSYDDYRAYLADFYAEKKQRDPQYSYKSFSIAAGIKSPNYLPLVIDGTRSLTTANIQQFAQALKLRPDETEYFEALVLWNQSKSPLEQKYYRGRLDRKKRERPARIAKASPITVMKEWYAPAVLILAHGRSNADAIKKCREALGLERDLVASTLQRLLEARVLRRESEVLKISSDQLTYHDPRSLNQTQEAFLHSQLEQSLRAFRRDYKKKAAKFLSHTLTAPPDSLEAIQAEFVAFMETLTQKMDEKVVADDATVLQFNIQIFQPRC
jgi:uncharacterized protein (TIGR02147 family)